MCVYNVLQVEHRKSLSRCLWTYCPVALCVCRFHVVVVTFVAPPLMPLAAGGGAGAGREVGGVNRRGMSAL